jgi:hypothetical protein
VGRLEAEHLILLRQQRVEVTHSGARTGRHHELGRLIRHHPTVAGDRQAGALDVPAKKGLGIPTQNAQDGARIVRLPDTLHHLHERMLGCLADIGLACRVDRHEAW